MGNVSKKKLKQTVDDKKYVSSGQDVTHTDDDFVSSHFLDYESCVNDTFVPRNWCLDTDSIPRYVGLKEWPPRKVRHYTHTGYEKCLANKTIVFIGDSRVRYQFMHLAGFLKSKQRMKCEDYGSLSGRVDAFEPSPECYLIEHEHHANMRSNSDWTSWYRRSTDMINSNPSNDNEMSQQRSLCDCYRGVPFRPKGTSENRFLIRSTPFGEIKLIFLQNFQNEISMNADYPPFSTFTGTKNRCKTGECGWQNRSISFKGNLNETLWNILPLLNTTHAFVNLGWEFMFGFQNQSRISCELRVFEKLNKNVKLHLLSHPPITRNTIDPTVSFDATKLECDCNVLDRSVLSTGVPHEWYWDQGHVLSILNEEYNHQLVEKVCPIQNV